MALFLFHTWNVSILDPKNPDLNVFFRRFYDIFFLIGWKLNSVVTKLRPLR